MKNTFLFIVAIIIAGGSGFALQKQLNKKPENTASNHNPVIGQQRAEFAAMDLEGQLRNIKEWDGKLILLNFWATWCPPCKKEIPAFIELQKAYGEQGVQFIGLAIDEQSAVAEFAEKTGINYPTLLVESDGIGLSKRYGNGPGVLPYTIVINRNGEVSDTIMGELSKKRAIELLKSHGINL